MLLSDIFARPRALSTRQFSSCSSRNRNHALGSRGRKDPSEWPVFGAVSWAGFAGPVAAVAAAVVAALTFAVADFAVVAAVVTVIGALQSGAVVVGVGRSYRPPNLSY